MTVLRYEIVRHEQGWAYRVGDTLSETFPNARAAHHAAGEAARRQRQPGETASILYEDAEGHWTAETDSGSDRPETSVKP